jgi:hypothetical protein
MGEAEVFSGGSGHFFPSIYSCHRSLLLVRRNGRMASWPVLHIKLAAKRVPCRQFKSLYEAAWH